MKWNELVELVGTEEELLEILKMPGICEIVRDKMIMIGKDNLKRTIYKHNFGHDTFGEVRKTEDGAFQCFETPLYGGDFQKVGDTFLNKEDAIQFLQSLT
jgi:hypothetical protein